MKIYAVFHLNLAYSSLEDKHHAEVVERCYWPLLRLIEAERLPWGIEATAYTLERISAVDVAWIHKLRDLLSGGVCEFLCSGDTQLIGPLVPESINRVNLRLGNAAYLQKLDYVPTIGYVNEQAFSASLVPLFEEAGCRAIMMEWDDAASHHPEWDSTWRYAPQRVAGSRGSTLGLLWNHSIAFQKFQRFVHGELVLEDYLSYLRSYRKAGALALPIYGNDAEVFDFRPGRYHTESRLLDTGEWRRIGELVKALSWESEIEWWAPSQILSICQSNAPAGPLLLGTATQPIPVKKQRKYNVSRWAVSGRNDLWLNTCCFRLHRALEERDPAFSEPELWRRLCRVWASDYRTHIADKRWSDLLSELDSLAGVLEVSLDVGRASLVQPSWEGQKNASCLGEWLVVREDETRRILHLETRELRLALNLRRGGAVESLGFGSRAEQSYVGTIPHGYFDSIELGADFYTGGVVIELPSEHRRITDLNDVAYTLTCDKEYAEVTISQCTDKGVINKYYRMRHGVPELEYAVDFPAWERPMGTVRVGHVTLWPNRFQDKLWYACRSGGNILERFQLDRPCLHTQPPSTLVSCSTGLGATDGQLLIGDAHSALKLSWDPALGAALPMIHYQPSRPASLLRVVFSLAELDETRRPGGRLMPLRLTLSPYFGKHT